MTDTRPYIVLLGDVGAGKSTLVEKLTGATGRSSASHKSVTAMSKAFESYDGSLIICDTPGSNPMDDQFQNNLYIAHAMNFMPVTCILIVSKADERIDQVVKNVREYAEGFIPEDLPLELIGVCVTHMDTVKWTGDDLLPYLNRHIGIETAVFSSLETSQEKLNDDLHKLCEDKHPTRLSVDEEMFLTLFKSESTNLKVLIQVRKEVSRFEKMKLDFFERKEQSTCQDSINMTFEFLKFVLDEIEEAKKRLSAANLFNPADGPVSASEAGHVASMSNQLHEVLNAVKIEADTYQRNTNTNFRKCSFCPAIWQESDIRANMGVCGAHSSTHQPSSVMSTFEFVWDAEVERLTIVCTKDTENCETSYSGCGKAIDWSEIAPVVEVGLPPCKQSASLKVRIWSRLRCCSPSRLRKTISNKFVTIKNYFNCRISTEESIHVNKGTVETNNSNAREVSRTIDVTEQELAGNANIGLSGGFMTAIPSFPGLGPIDAVYCTIL